MFWYLCKSNISCETGWLCVCFFYHVSSVPLSGGMSGLWGSGTSHSSSSLGSSLISSLASNLFRALGSCICIYYSYCSYYSIHGIHIILGKVDRLYKKDGRSNMISPVVCGLCILKLKHLHFACCHVLFFTSRNDHNQMRHRSAKVTATAN